MYKLIDVVSQLLNQSKNVYTEGLFVTDPSDKPEVMKQELREKYGRKKFRSSMTRENFENKQRNALYINTLASFGKKWHRKTHPNEDADETWRRAVKIHLIQNPNTNREWLEIMEKQWNDSDEEKDGATSDI